MPKIFLNQSTIKDGWERNPDASGDADFKDPDIRQNRRGKFMPKILKITAALYLQSCGCSLQLLLNFTPISSSHSSPICFHPAPCIEIRDSRAVILEVIKRF
jgi:hypothetical protein